MPLRFLNAAIGVSLLLMSCGKWRASETVYIPRGYVGWVKIQYSVADAPPLEEKDGRFIIRVPSNGRVKTSTPMASGLGNDEYYYVDPVGATEQLRLAETVKDESGQIRATRYITIPKLENQEPKQGREFFVGSPIAYEKSARDENWLMDAKR